MSDSWTMKNLLNQTKIMARLKPAWGWVHREVLSLSSLVQFLVIGLVLLLSWLLARPLKPYLNGLLARRDWSDRKVG